MRGAPDRRARPPRRALRSPGPRATRARGRAAAGARGDRLRRAMRRGARPSAAARCVRRVRAGLSVPTPGPGRRRPDLRGLHATRGGCRGDFAGRHRGLRASPVGVLGRGVRAPARPDRGGDRRAPRVAGHSPHRPSDTLDQVPARPPAAASDPRRPRGWPAGLISTVMAINMDVLVSLSKRRGFVFQSSEIYGGTGSVWDYGPLGVELKNNIKRVWWRDFVQSRADMVGIDAAILMHPTVWKASGHLEHFTDPMVDCRECKHRFRADHVDARPWVHYCPATKGNKFTIPAGEPCSHCGQRRTLL